MRKWSTQVSTVVVNVGRELSLLKMAINMANADYPSFFLWNELEPRCQQRAAGSLELTTRQHWFSQVIAWRGTGGKLLSEPVRPTSLTNICGLTGRWVNLHQAGTIMSDWLYLQGLTLKQLDTFLQNQILFSNVIHYKCNIYTFHSTKLKGGYTGFTLSVHLSVRLSALLSLCGQNRVRSVSSTTLAGPISYLHILSSNIRRCVTYKVCLKIWKFAVLANSLNL